MNVLVLGASGFIGRHLTSALAQRGDTVVEASLRDPAKAAAAAALCDAVVNLAGEPIAQRWTPAAKERIERSRIEPQHRFLDALGKIEHRVRTYVSASGIGYYGRSETATFDEGSPPGDDFLARVCEAWERAALRARDLGMRVAIVRTGVVLGTDGGALAKMLPPFRLGLGGTIGTGRQWYSWIHIDDAIGIYRAAIDGAQGAVNATSPNPATNAEFTRALGTALHRPTLFPTPTFALRLALGEGATILLTGQRVLPKCALDELGYTFLFPHLDGALANLLAR